MRALEIKGPLLCTSTNRYLDLRFFSFFSSNFFRIFSCFLAFKSFVAGFKFFPLAMMNILNK